MNIYTQAFVFLFLCDKCLRVQFVIKNNTTLNIGELFLKLARN